MSDRAGEWVPIKEAARLLGVHYSAVPKMTRRGLLHPRKDRRPSLSRAEVLELRDARAEQARLRSLPPPVKGPPPAPEPPDKEHAWVRANVVAAHLGVSVTAVHQRCRRGRLPYALGLDGKTRFFLLRQVEATLRAQELTRSRDVAAVRAGGASGVSPG